MTDPAARWGWQGSGPDFEVYTEPRCWRWCAYDEDILIGTGTARTRLGLAIAIRRFARKQRAA